MDSIRDNLTKDDWTSLEGQIIGALARSVRDLGGRLWVVGGAPRDLLRGAPIHEMDCEVFGLSQSRLQSLLERDGHWELVGRSFPVWKRKGAEIDVALPRKERKSGPKHQDFTIEVAPEMSLKDAARRRDFTINAILIDPLSGQIEDPYNGLEDLRSGILRHTSEQFSEDPLRVLRGMQFAARMQLIPAEETIALCRKLDQDDLPRERLFEEWKKLILKGEKISRGLNFLRAANWLRFYPELSALVGCKQDPRWHPEGDVWNHTLHCLDHFAQNRTGDEREDLIVGLAVLCHDLGKPATTVFSEGRWRSPDHERAGMEPAENFLHQLTAESDLIEEVLVLVKTHMRPQQLFSARAGSSAIRRLANEVKRIDRLIRVAESDANGRPPLAFSPYEPGTWLAAQAGQLAIANSQPKPILQGRDLQQLGMTPGPAMGKLLRDLFEEQLDGQFSNREEGLLRASARLESDSGESS